MPDITPTRWPYVSGLFLLAVTAVFFLVVQPFWKPIFWAIVFTLLFWSLRVRWTVAMGGRATLATSAILLLILFGILVPMLFLAALVADGAAAVVAAVRDIDLQPATFYTTLETRFPGLFERLAGFGITFEAAQSFGRDAALAVGQFALALAPSLAQGATGFGFDLFIFLYLAFAFLRTGDAIYAALFAAVPMRDHQKEVFFQSFAEMSAATIRGTVAVGLVQGTMGGLAFAVVGLPGPVFWGALMAFLSIIPPFGAGFVWAPAAAFLIVTGDLVSGIGLLIWGVVFISMSDNFVRPAIVGRATSMPDYMVLLATLGGLSLFGLTGLLVGPIVAALFLAGWKLNTLAAEEGEDAEDDDSEAGRQDG